MFISEWATVKSGFRSRQILLCFTISQLHRQPSKRQRNICSSSRTPDVRKDNVSWASTLKNLHPSCTPPLELTGWQFWRPSIWSPQQGSLRTIFFQQPQAQVAVLSWLIPTPQTRSSPGHSPKMDMELPELVSWLIFATEPANIQDSYKSLPCLGLSLSFSTLMDQRTKHIHSFLPWHKENTSVSYISSYIAGGCLVPCSTSCSFSASLN